MQLPNRYFSVGTPTITLSKERSNLLREFHEYQKNHYKKEPLPCPCGSAKNDALVSKIDRTGYPFPVVACKSCGLVRAEEYWTAEDTLKYYEDWYRKCYSGGTEETPESLWKTQLASSKEIFNFIKTHIENKPNACVVDIGGGVGGILSPFKENGYKTLLADFNKRYLKFGQDKGLDTFVGGIKALSEAKMKFDVVILSHVIEHFVDFMREMKELTSILNKGAIVYIGVPGLDSLKTGRRSYDFLLDIQDAHVYYFSSYTLKNLLSVIGFKELKSDTEIKALFEFTGEKKQIENYFSKTMRDLYLAEAIRVSKLPNLYRWVKSKVSRTLNG